MKNTLMIQSQLLILLITFLPFTFWFSKIKFSNKSLKKSLSSEINDYFLKTSTNNEEIYKIIKSLNSNKSCGPNSIPTKVLHLLQDQISNHLATICNLSFSTGVFPAILKTAEVIPIHKKNSKLEVSNYRPISLLSNIDKFFEKLMKIRLIELLEGKTNSLLQAAWV